MGNEFSLDGDSTDDPSLDCPLLDRLPTKDELLPIVDKMPNKGMMKYVLNNWDKQRQLDLRWSLLSAQQHEDEMTFDEWKQIYKRAGFVLTSTVSKNRRGEKMDFPSLNETSRYELMENFTMPEKIPRKCDHCDVVLDAPKYCICGETYCNEMCRGEEKRNHRQMCATVQENNMCAMTLIRRWQREQGQGAATSGGRGREPVVVSRTLFRDNVLSFGGVKVVSEVFGVYSRLGDPNRNMDLCALADGDGPAAVHASYLYGKLCNDPECLGTPEYQAPTYLQRAADQGLGPAWVVLGNIARDEGDFKRAKECWLRALSICRIPEAAYNIGIIYGLGYDGPKDYSLAMDFYEEAVNSPLPHCGGKGLPNVIADRMIYGIYTGNNETQATFVTQARHNLSVVRRSGTKPAGTIQLVDSNSTKVIESSQVAQRTTKKKKNKNQKKTATVGSNNNNSNGDEELSNLVAKIDIKDKDESSSSSSSLNSNSSSGSNVQSDVVSDVSTTDNDSSSTAVTSDGLATAASGTDSKPYQNRKKGGKKKKNKGKW